MVNFMLWPLYPQEKFRDSLLEGVDFLSGLDGFGEERVTCRCLEIFTTL